jgi:hypothetical protein
MAPFWKRQPDWEPELARLRGELAELRTRVLEAERVASDCASDAYKRMKKAEQAERRALAAAESVNQEPGSHGDVPPVTPLAPPLTGVRARIAARRAGRGLPIQWAEDANGIHS